MAKRGDYGADIDVEKMVAERASSAFAIRRQPLWAAHRQRTRLVEFTFNPLPDGRVLAVGHDVTEVKQREEALRAAADILKLISRGRFDLQDRARHAGGVGCRGCARPMAPTFSSSTAIRFA